MVSETFNHTGSYEMTNTQAEFILRVLFNNKVYGYPNKVAPNYIESDGRKQKRALRDLVEAGYLSQTGEEFTATDKLFNEIAPEPVNLNDLWQQSRGRWNGRRQYDFVRWTSLTDGQKRTVLECAGHYQWYVCNVCNFDAPLQDGDLHGPVDNPDSNLGTKIKALVEAGTKVLKEQKRGGYFPELEVVLKMPGLTAHVEKTLADEKFEALYRGNLKWALAQLNIASSDDAGEIVTADEPDWVLGGSANSNLGTDPEKWGDVLNEKIANVAAGIARMQRRLAIMESIRENVNQMGGWDAFREQYKAKLKEELSKPSE
jgi:hypothetical protein